MAQQEHYHTQQNPKKASSSHLSREDFDGGPVSLDQIEKGLFLGWFIGWKELFPLTKILSTVVLTLTYFSGNVTAATDKESLQSHDITHILTVDSCPLPSHVLQISTLTNKYIQGTSSEEDEWELKWFIDFSNYFSVSDVAKEDLLSHFDECIEFIENALLNNKRILVHW